MALQQLLAYYGLADRGEASKGLPGGELKQEERVDNDVSAEQATYGLGGAGPGGADKEAWVRMHLDIMRTNIADNAIQRGTLLGAGLSKLPRAAKVAASAVLLVLFIAVAVPVMVALPALLGDNGDKSKTVMTKLGLHLIIAIGVAALAYVPL